VLLYWHASNEIDRNYTVFVHLEDSHGNLITGHDTQPRNGNAPTSQWRRYVPLVDPIVMPIPTDVPVGTDYRLRIGVYYLPTMQRLAIVDAQGRPLGDSLTLSPLSIVE
ncbi:MAG: hypothetical protein N2559_12585, partial [Anaerolineae bacterium]|nr:hypothetical protein [Anaerolineae bacterium]